MMNLRSLYPERDIELYHAAWGWLKDYPKRYMALSNIRTFGEWMKYMEFRLSVGMFDPELVGIISLEPKGGALWEAHLDLKRSTDLVSVLTAALSFRKQVFEEFGIEAVEALVMSRHLGIIRVARECGFKRDGYEVTHNGVRWIRLMQTRSDYLVNYEQTAAVGNAVGQLLD